jgi:tryptophanyl-tRNA synthetase
MTLSKTESGQVAPPTGERPRVLSGMRPTGRLHLGNYMGALYNWVKLQHEYECYFFIADWHALTTDYADTSKLKQNVLEVALDFLSAGLDPQTVFIQSHVPQHAELHVLLSMFTPLSLLERVPSYKDQQEQLREKDLATYGFLGYPLLQSADILLYQPDFVPVGQDQASHVELTREVARRFNQLYSPKRLIGADPNSLAEEPDPTKLILPEPQVLLTPSPKLPGIDGRKMSKSYGNSILMSDPPAFILDKMSRMSNGGQRSPQTEPGNPDWCPVGNMHTLFSEARNDSFIRNGCTTASIPCSQCKEMAANGIILSLFNIRQKRERLEENPDEVWSILDSGAKRASARAEQTMEHVRSVMGLSRARPVRPPTSKRAYSASSSGRSGHDLAMHSDWWDMEQSVRARNMRDYWLSQILPFDINLTQDSDRVFITQKKKRVYVTTSRENNAEEWGFESKLKTYEVMALLCWDHSFRIHDFIVPQTVYQSAWNDLKKKSPKDMEIVFWVKRSGDQFYLELPNAKPVEITAYRGDYKAVS